MKKFILLAAIFMSVGSSGYNIDAKPIEATNPSSVELRSGSPLQISIQIGNRRQRRVRRPLIRTRIIYINRRRYRETYQIRYLNNGRTRRQVVRRVRMY